MDGLLNFLSRKRSRGPAAPSGLGRAAGRGSDAFHDARERRAAQQAAVHDTETAVRYTALHELYAAPQFEQVPIYVRQHELFGIIFHALEQTLAAGDDEAPIVYWPPVHASEGDGAQAPFFLSTRTEHMPASVTMVQEASATLGSPIASRRLADADSPSLDLTAAQLELGESAKRWDAALAQLHSAATATAGLLLSQYETAHEQSSKLVWELARLQQLHYDAVAKLHREMHPETLTDWRRRAEWALTGCGMTQHRSRLRDECASVVSAVDTLAKGIVDWVDSEEQLPPVDLAELAHSTLGEAPLVKLFIKCLWLKGGGSNHAGYFDVRARQRKRRGARTGATASGGDGDDDRDDDGDGEEVRDEEVRDEDEEAMAAAAAAVIALVRGDQARADGDDQDEAAAAAAAAADPAEATATIEQRAAGRKRAELERDHRYGLTLLTLAQVSMIGSSANAPNLRKLRGLIDHATKTPPARVSLASALHERGSQRDADKTLLARAGRVAMAAEGISKTKDTMDSIDNASFQVRQSLQNTPLRGSDRSRLRDWTYAHRGLTYSWVIFFMLTLSLDTKNRCTTNLSASRHSRSSATWPHGQHPGRATYAARQGIGAARTRRTHAGRR